MLTLQNWQQNCTPSFLWMSICITTLVTIKNSIYYWFRFPWTNPTESHFQFLEYNTY